MAIRGFHRTWPLEGIEIVRGGSGRVVEAYAAIFDVLAEIRDRHGHYRERIDRRAFTDLSRAVCLYNHGASVSGKAHALAIVPLGKPLEIRPDGRGLLTITRYNNTELADAVLESIRNGDITSQSFRGRIVRSSPERVPRTTPGGPLPTITRLELGLSDYGPTPFPYYPGATITAVRAALDGHGRLRPGGPSGHPHQPLFV